MFLLKSFMNFWFGRKYLLTNLINILLLLVFIYLLKCGLNQMMLCFLFFLFQLFSFGCWYCSLVLDPLFFKHFDSKWLTPGKYFWRRKVFFESFFIWFNPPHSKSKNINIKKKFIKVINTFQQITTSKVLLIETMKLSCSCLPGIRYKK